MQYTREQKELMKKTLAKKVEKKKLDEQKMRDEAISKAEKIATFLKTSYNVKNVYLFGSLVWRNRFTAHSDIDIYLVGFPKDRDYWEALAKSEEIAMPFPVTIVMEENASPEMKQKIEEEGLLL